MKAKSKKQAKAAQLEYIRRNIWGVKKEKKATRSFGAISDDHLKDFIGMG